MNSTTQQIQQDYDRLDEVRQQQLADLAASLIEEQREDES